MSELTEHQRSIMQAVLLGLDIQMRYNLLGWQLCNIWEVFDALSKYEDCTEILRIKPGQDEKVVRLYELTTQRTATYRCFIAYKDQFSAEYIDINHTTGAIVGGRI